MAVPTAPAPPIKADSCCAHDAHSTSSPTDKGAKKPFWKALATSRFFVALAIFVAVCQVMSAVQFGKRDPADFPYDTWTSWAIKDFIAKRPDNARPQLVFMGSSLVLVPLDGLDADYMNKTVDASKHHKSVFFEDHFKKYSGSPVRTYNFALPGEMPSDAYFLTKFLMKDENKPQVVVYGVGPRDFLDNLLPSPSATDPYRYISRFGDVSSHARLVVPQWEERLNYELERSFYTYKQRTDLKEETSRFFEKLTEKFNPSKPASVHIRRTLMPEYHQFEIQENECFFRPTTPESRSKFSDNLDEYRKRYKKLKRETFDGQMTFLGDLLKTANERKILPVVVAMPITEANRQILSDEIWNTYRTTLEKTARSNGAVFIDMHAKNAFNLADFGDTVHLHSGGGAKFFDLLAQELAKNVPVKEALGASNKAQKIADKVAEVGAGDVAGRVADKAPRKGGSL